MRRAGQVNCEGKRIALSYEFSAKKRCAKIAELSRTYQAYKAVQFWVADKKYACYVIKFSHFSGLVNSTLSGCFLWFHSCLMYNSYKDLRFLEKRAKPKKLLFPAMCKERRTINESPLSFFSIQSCPITQDPKSAFRASWV